MTFVEKAKELVLMSIFGLISYRHRVIAPTVRLPLRNQTWYYNARKPLTSKSHHLHVYVTFPSISYEILVFSF
jgi:DNA-binding transcriptional regulator YbjK